MVLTGVVSQLVRYTTLSRGTPAEGRCLLLRPKSPLRGPKPGPTTV